jgi:hypothetical protein
MVHPLAFTDSQRSLFHALSRALDVTPDQGQDGFGLDVLEPDRLCYGAGMMAASMDAP